MIDEKIEKVALGTMLMDSLALENGLMMLDVDCFTLEWHRKIFTSIKSLTDQNREIDVFLVAEHSKVNFEDISLIMEHSVSSIESHCKRLKELKNIRLLFNMAANVQSMARNGGEYSDITESIEGALNGLSGSNTNYIVEHIKESVSATFEAIEGRNDLNTPIQFGFPSLDNIVGGIFPSEFVVIGARPGMGKTAFILNAIMNMSKKNEEVLLFSLEMKTTQLVMRYFASEAEIDSNLIRNKELKKRDYDRLSDAASVVYNSNIYVNSSKRNTVHDIKAIARRHLRNYPNTKAIVIDYIQLIKDSKELRHDKRLANEEKSLVLCELAAELNVSIICLAQLSRSCEARNNKRPMPSDLKEAGQIEQDAHIIGFLYRGYKYGDSYKNKNGDSVEYTENDVDFIIAKNREGRTGTVQMAFRGEYSKFYNIDVVHEEPEGGNHGEVQGW
jgi:replicative DNA helicase